MPSWARRASWVPCSAMRPWWMTMMREARRTVERRWAIDDRRAAAHQLGDAALDHAFGLGIDAGGRLVEDQDLRGAREGAGEGDELALADGEVRAAFEDARVEAPGRDAIARSAPTRRAAERMRSSSMAPSSRPMFARSVPANMNTSWLTATMRLRSWRGSIVLMSTPSMRISPAFTS